MAKGRPIDPAIPNLIVSITVLFEELCNAGHTKSTDFTMLRGQILGCLEGCSKRTVNRALTNHRINLPNGIVAENEITRPPTWMNISADDRAVLERPTKPKTFVKKLQGVLHRQQKEYEDERERSSDRSSNRSSEPLEPAQKQKRLRGKEAHDEDEYMPPAAKKAKKQQQAKPVQLMHQTPRQRKLKVFTNKSAKQENTPKQEKSGEKQQQQTLHFPITKNLNNNGNTGKKDVKQSQPMGQVKQRLKGDTFVRKSGTDLDSGTCHHHDFQRFSEKPEKAEHDEITVKREFSEPPRSSKQDSSSVTQNARPAVDVNDQFDGSFLGAQHSQGKLNSAPIKNEGYVTSQNDVQSSSFATTVALPKIETSHEPEGQTLVGQHSPSHDLTAADTKVQAKAEEHDYPLNLFSQSVGQPKGSPQFDDTASEVSDWMWLDREEDYEQDSYETDIDTDDESDNDSIKGSEASSVAIDSNPDKQADYWASAPKTLKTHADFVLQHHNLPLRQKVESPLQRLRANLEIYNSRIAHIPKTRWVKYNKKLEKFVQEPKFLSMTFNQRLGRFRHIVYLDEELVTMGAEDWESTRKTASLCAWLVEVASLHGEDAQRFAQREVEGRTMDINWLEETCGTKVRVAEEETATEKCDAMEGVETSGKTSIEAETPVAAEDVPGDAMNGVETHNAQATSS